MAWLGGWWPVPAAFTALHCYNSPGSFPTSLSQQTDVYTQGCYTKDGALRDWAL